MKKLVLYTLIAVLAAVAVFAQTDNKITINAHTRSAIAPFIYQSPHTHLNSLIGVYEEEGKSLIGFGAPNAISTNLTELYVRGAVSGYLGFSLGVGFAGANPGRNTTIGAYVWAKPLGNEFLKVSVGNVTDLTLQGKVGVLRQQFEYFTLRHVIVNNPFAENANFRELLLKANWENEGIFERFWSRDGPALMLSSEPIENLYIGAMIKIRDKYSNNPNDIQYSGAGIPDSSIWFNNTNVSNVPASDAWRFIQIGAGYTIPGIGLARLQFFGGHFKDDLKELQELTDLNNGNLPSDPSSELFINYLKTRDQAPKIQTAFAFTGIKDLLVDAGITVWLPVKYEGKVTNKYTGAHVLDIKEGGAWNGIRLGLGATYSWGAFILAGRTDMNFGGYEQHYVCNTGLGVPEQKDLKSSDGFQLVFRFSPSYNFGFATLGLDFGIGVKGQSTNEHGQLVNDQLTAWGIGASIRKSFGTAHILTGFAYSSPIYGSSDRFQYNNPSYFTIPIVLWLDI